MCRVASLRLIQHTPYYGTHDATTLYVLTPARLALAGQPGTASTRCVRMSSAPWPGSTATAIGTGTACRSTRRGRARAATTGVQRGTGLGQPPAQRSRAPHVVAALAAEDRRR